MLVLNQAELKATGKRHPIAKKALQNWLDIVFSADWKSLADVKLSFPSVDYIPVDQYCFNIKGNSYRLLTAISFKLKTVTVIEFLTHAEYSKRSLKTK